MIFYKPPYLVLHVRIRTDWRRDLTTGVIHRRPQTQLRLIFTALVFTRNSLGCCLFHVHSSGLYLFIYYYYFESTYFVVSLLYSRVCVLCLEPVPGKLDSTAKFVSRVLSLCHGMQMVRQSLRLVP